MNLNMNRFCGDSNEEDQNNQTNPSDQATL